MQQTVYSITEIIEAVNKLYQDYPDLAYLPPHQIEPRIERAALLVNSTGSPRTWQQGRYHVNELATVESQTPGTIYSIYLESHGCPPDDQDYIACNCPDCTAGWYYYRFAHGKPAAPVINGLIACKHTIAHLLAQYCATNRLYNTARSLAAAPADWK